MERKINRCIEVIQQYIPPAVPKVGIILGSGLGPLADQIEQSVPIPYEDLPHFPESTVAGHSGTLVLGTLSGVPVACLKGRVHFYEGDQSEGLKILIRTLRQLGCNTLITTNASGSLRTEVPAGEVVLINDHINLAQVNPMIGSNDETFGPRFFPMDDAYDKELGAKMHKTAEQLGIKLHDGVYLMTIGPNFETPAEIRAFKVLGADLVGMSTIPDVLVARHCGMRVVAISAVTNLAAGLSDESLSHEGTLKYAKLSEDKLCRLVKTFLKEYKDELSK
ncbi:MAG: purine-nucleoside phosphorylase [Pseudomonadota bacterium]|nr:purine-nucleoside phosphorylase [Gammaproteobacteria bacterium]MBU1558565.1 purine-nucleoside phosphorylase [Gammaproteobacteria bacterium]MBU1629065.1 purine-nucleoside phosphorylase [Gammaproteobacteria bacterium]MBU1926277.1 purine-nucleoside phosphorylase [Gammaproteobacteria bacterium]MBU2546490.1 purine-nucleoside phosphorylase [Gammaproteobacteria bacterium]